MIRGGNSVTVHRDGLARLTALHDNWGDSAEALLPAIIAYVTFPLLSGFFDTFQLPFRE